MADSSVSAFAHWLSKLTASKAGEHEGKAVRIWFVGNATGYNCVVLDYDAVGVHVKNTLLQTSRPEDTQFYPWHTIARIEA